MSIKILVFLYISQKLKSRFLSSHFKSLTSTYPINVNCKKNQFNGIFIETFPKGHNNQKEKSYSKDLNQN